MITSQEHSTFCSLKVPAAVSLHPQFSAELSFGECLSENDWLAPLLSGKIVAEFGCSAGLRAAYLAPYTRQIFCTDPDAVYLRLARKTLKLNQRRNVVVIDNITDITPVDALLLDIRRYSDGALPEFPPQAALLVITGPLPRSTASRVLDAGYEHLPQYHRAAVFAAPRRQHGVQ
ncbi:class I SAM-dependent methyltransferase [Phaeobacter sp. CNT1-3]|nr:class I SAM-dependent methyltransferase [Phaeobacter sp. CNT1-3]